MQEKCVEEAKKKFLNGKQDVVFSILISFKGKKCSLAVMCFNEKS